MIAKKKITSEEYLMKMMTIIHPKRPFNVSRCFLRGILSKGNPFYYQKKKKRDKSINKTLLVVLIKNLKCKDRIMNINENGDNE